MTAVWLLAPTIGEHAIPPSEMRVPEQCDETPFTILVTPPEYRDEARRQAHLLVARCGSYVAIHESPLGPVALSLMVEEAMRWESRLPRESPGPVLAYLRRLSDYYVSVVWRRTAFGLDQPAATVSQLLGSVLPRSGYLADLRDGTLRHVDACRFRSYGRLQQVSVHGRAALPARVADRLGVPGAEHGPGSALTQHRFGRHAREITGRRPGAPVIRAPDADCPSCLASVIGPSCQFCHHDVRRAGAARQLGRK